MSVLDAEIPLLLRAAQQFHYLSSTSLTLPERMLLLVIHALMILHSIFLILTFSSGLPLLTTLDYFSVPGGGRRRQEGAACLAVCSPLIECPHFCPCRKRGNAGGPCQSFFHFLSFLLTKCTQETSENSPRHATLPHRAQSIRSFCKRLSQGYAGDNRERVCTCRRHGRGAGQAVQICHRAGGCQDINM